MTPRVVNKRSGEPFDVYVGRPSKWGNPFVIGARWPGHNEPLTREQVIARYRTWLLAQPELVEQAKQELRDKTLACWCAPKPCHADVLLEIANV